MLRLSGENNAIDKILIKALKNEMKRKAIQAKFIMVIEMESTIWGSNEQYVTVIRRKD